MKIIKQRCCILSNPRSVTANVHKQGFSFVRKNNVLFSPADRFKRINAFALSEHVKSADKNHHGLLQFHIRLPALDLIDVHLAVIIPAPEWQFSRIDHLHLNVVRIAFHIPDVYVQPDTLSLIAGLHAFLFLYNTKLRYPDSHDPLQKFPAVLRIMEHGTEHHIVPDVDFGKISRPAGNGRRFPGYCVFGHLYLLCGRFLTVNQCFSQTSCF